MPSSCSCFLLPLKPLRTFPGPSRLCYNSRTSKRPRPPFHRLRCVAAGAAAASGSAPLPTWRQLSRTHLYIPANPSLLLHFIGGAFAGGAPQLFYRALLEGISAQTRAAVVATSFDVSGDHWSIAEDVSNQWQNAIEEIGYKDLGVVGMGHSLGGKLLVMLECNESLRKRIGERRANITMAFNNYGADRITGNVKNIMDGLGNIVEDFGLNRDVVDLKTIAGTVSQGIGLFSERFGGQFGGMEQVLGGVRKATDAVAEGKEFTPSPQEVQGMADRIYNVDRTLIVKFVDDGIDESEDLMKRLRSRLGEQRVLYREIPGTHVTPLTPDLQDVRQIRNEAMNQAVQSSAEKARRELQQLITITSAFIKLQANVAKMTQSS